MSTEAKVNNEHPKYAENRPKRAVFHAVKGGTDAIQKGSTTYLPKYPAEAGYDVRLKASTIDGIVAGGVESLTGAVFEGEVDTSKVNPQIVPLLENIDNCGNHFNVFVRDAFEASFDGHSVILVDMPVATAAAVALRQERGAEADILLNTRPYWTLYKADDVINWRYRVNPLTQRRQLSLIVVKVVTSEAVGMFGSKNVTRYRVWFINDAEQVAWQVWREADKDVTGTTMADPVMETSGVLSVTEIPVAIVGDLDCEPKLLTESRLEVKAYQKESSFDQIEYLSIPLPVFKGRPAEHIGKPMPYGPDVCADISEKGDAFYMQIDSAGHDSLKGTIKGIKDTIASRLDYIAQQPMPAAGDKTATQVVVEDKDKQARLIVWAEQLKDAVELALGFTAEFMGLGKDHGGEITLNTAWAIAEQKRMEREAMKAEQDMANVAATMAKANG